MQLRCGGVVGIIENISQRGRRCRRRRHTQQVVALILLFPELNTIISPVDQYQQHSTKDIHPKCTQSIRCTVQYFVISYAALVISIIDQ